MNINLRSKKCSGQSRYGRYGSYATESAALPPLATVAETAQGFKDARHLTSYLSQRLRTDHQRQAASRSYKIIHDGLRSLQVSVVHKRPIQLIANATDSANHFSVKLSPFICMLAACSGSPPQCSTFSSNEQFCLSTHSSIYIYKLGWV